MGISRIREFVSSYRELRSVGVGTNQAIGESSKIITTLAKAFGVAEGSMFAFLTTSTAIVAAIVGVTVVVDLLTESYEEASKAADQAKQSYTNTLSDIDSLNSELETTKSKIAELHQSGPLSFVEQAELGRLEARANLLERQLEIKERIAELEGAGAAREANHVLTKTRPTDQNGQALSMGQELAYLSLQQFDSTMGGLQYLDDISWL